MTKMINKGNKKQMQPIIVKKKTKKNIIAEIIKFSK